MNPFKVGDTVKIIDSGWGTDPKDVGKTTKVLALLGSTRIAYDTTGLNIGKESWVLDGRYSGNVKGFEKVEQPKEQEMVQKIKAGDKVRVTCNSGNNFSKGDIVTVIRPDFGGYAILEGTITNYLDSRRGKVDTQSLRPDQFEAIKPSFDFTKPLFTAEGTPVVLVTKTNPRDPKFPVLVYEGKAGVPTKYDLNGKAKNGVARRNLTNEVPKPEKAVTEKFVALLDGKHNPEGQQVGIKLYDTAENARVGALASARGLSVRGPVGIAKVTLVSGRWPV